MALPARGLGGQREGWQVHTPRAPLHDANLSARRGNLHSHEDPSAATAQHQGSHGQKCHFHAPLLVLCGEYIIARNIQGGVQMTAPPVGQSPAGPAAGRGRRQTGSVPLTASSPQLSLSPEERAPAPSARPATGRRGRFARRRPCCVRCDCPSCNVRCVWRYPNLVSAAWMVCSTFYGREVRRLTAPSAARRPPRRPRRRRSGTRRPTLRPTRTS